MKKFSKICLIIVAVLGGMGLLQMCIRDRDTEQRVGIREYK